ncbi:MAG: TIGR03936 family radical SAM-associated protein, partial [Syntrophomonadaceae bacterium]|nr:TIGR03936 family radical SAM-associated protein [Syntrophomonadaceae bacterium]
MRLRAEYRIGPELKFLANLDMMNVIGRTLRRAAIPYALSEGFNPHIKLSLGTVLPVGLWGEKEYFDLELTMPVET